MLETITPLLPELIVRSKLTKEEATLLYDYANHALTTSWTTLNPATRVLIVQALRRSAQTGFAPAQFRYGLWLGRLDEQGEPIPLPYAGRNCSLKKAAQWIELAAANGVVEACYVLAKLYRRTQFSQYSAKQSDYFFLQAAQLGHAQAQLQFGKILWRSRRLHENGDVKGSFWIWKAAKQNLPEAQALVKKIMRSQANAEKNQWAEINQLVTAQTKNIEDALLIQRINIAYQFNLDRAEMLLLDIVESTHEHCIVVDIQEWLPRSLRKLILIETTAQFTALSHANKIFKENEVAVAQEGNYRQRRYRLNRFLLLLGVTLPN